VKVILKLSALIGICRDLQQSIIDISKEQSHSLGDRIIALPKELRDIIWEHYWLANPDLFRVDRTSYSSELEQLRLFLDRALKKDPTCIKTCSRPHECTCFTTKQLPNAVLPALVGHAVARDATVVGLQLLCDSIFENQEYPCLTRIQLEDLHYQLALDVCHVGYTFADFQSKFTAEYEPYKAKEMEYLKQQYAALRRLQRTSNLHITIAIWDVLYGAEGVTDHLEVTLEAFRDVYFELLGKGAVIEIFFHDVHVINVEDYYKLPLEIWQERMRDENPWCCD
jgi:hypothetical protein